MRERKPNFDDLVQVEEKLLSARLRTVRSAIVHPSEKGRSLEHEVMALLRSFLPVEYGLATGFVAYHGPALCAIMGETLEVS